MRIYRLLSRLSVPRTYAAKFLLLGFAGIHLPLLALVTFAAVRADERALPYLLIAFVATLVGSAGVLTLFFGLLAPVRETARSLGRYSRDGTVPSLPTHYADDAGRLMATTQQAIDRLERLNGFRQRLLGVLSHDIRTPLASILLAADLLDDDAAAGRVDPAFARELARTVSSGVEQMETLLSTLLSASQADAPHLPFAAEPVDTATLLNTTAVRVAMLAEHKGLRFAVHDHAPAVVTTDASQLEQVLVNLLTNAVKFTPPGKAVTLSTEAAARGVTFVVADEGIGMDAAQVSAAFTADGPEQRHGTAGEPGTGMGLWIVDTFVRHLGGHVALASTPGAGTTFRVFVPTTRPADALTRRADLDSPLGHA